MAGLMPWSSGQGEPHAAGFYQFLLESGGEEFLSSSLRTSGDGRKVCVRFKAAPTCVHYMMGTDHSGMHNH